MRVAMYYNNSDIRVEEMPVPQIDPSEVLLKSLACGICGSDVMEWYRIHKAPLVLGHEATGEIVEVGEDVTKFKKGDRVFVSHHVPCNTCHYCLNGNHTVCDTLRTTNFDPGGFAEYVRVPEINVDRGIFVLPDNMSLEDGTFIEPLACVVRGQRVARIEPGQTVVVIGSGMSGLLHILLARSLGAGKIIATDISEYRMEMAKKFGADYAISAHEDLPSHLLSVNNGRLADRVIVTAGAIPALNTSIKSVDRAGTVLYFAPGGPNDTLNIPFNDFWKNCITLMSTYGASPLDIDVAIELISSQRVPVKEMITHRLGLTETQHGFKLVSEAKESIKVVIEPHK
ncbi:alcohol dehydrogenase [Candidatus Scalindua japonica]|uniref:Alcohol dehydrogenase n=1 Tax=Candidatus Scalindua japonica TaxID=1284222 RepID=A0A286TY44_9BACT|nr:zinc-dependent dehydrogenase [Candidatus Scalindua japonica]GAX60790.1 alcohol dehydrogenase [Candidatus Scalindua japonica]